MSTSFRYISRLEISEDLPVPETPQKTTGKKTTEVYSPMASGEKSRFLVLLAYRAEIGADDFKVSILPHKIPCHLEHAKVKVCDWTK